MKRADEIADKMAYLELASQRAGRNLLTKCKT
jgi:hypothetical protein